MFRTRRTLRRKWSSGMIDSLEPRTLLSIAWANRGTEGFDTLFGANVALARTIVDRAINDWQTVITSFNQPPGQSTFNLTVQCVDIGSIASASITATSNNKPTAATITVDSAGTTHWLDPTPLDDAEFDDNLTNAFTNYAVTPAITGVDFYATIVHELGHALGIAFNRADLAIQGFLTNTGIDDPNTTNPGNLVAFNVNGGPIEATFTAADTGHLWEGPATTATNNAGLPTHVDLLMNPGRAIQANERNLISDLEAAILRDAYGYTVRMPSTINNMLCNPNFSTDVLTVTGLPSNAVGNPADTFLIQGTANPNELHVTADGFVEIVPLNEVGSIVVNGLGGDDLCQLEYTAGRFTTFNGGSGTDTLDLSFAVRNLNNISGPTLFNGGAGADFMHLYDNNNASSDAWSVDNTRLTRTGTGLQQYDGEVENVFLTTGTAANTVNITTTSSLTKLYLNSSAGQDQVNIGPGTGFVNGDIEIQNSPSFTTVNISDAGSAVSRTASTGYTAGTGNAFAHVAGMSPGTVFFKITDVAAVNITSGSASDSMLIADTPRPVNYHNTGGADVVRVGNSVNGTNTIFQNVNVTSGGIVLPTVIVDNVAGSAHNNTVLGVSGGVMNVNGMTGGGIISCPSTTAIQLYGSSFNDVFALNNTLNMSQALVDAGGGSDIVSVVGARITSLTVRGGTDAALDFLDILDASMPTNVVGGTVYADRVVRDTAVPLDVFYSGFSSINWYQQNQQNGITVRGTPADIGANYQFSIIGNTVDDFVQVYTQDATGNPTILGNLAFNGGGGPDIIQVFAGPTAANYRFYDPFGGSTAYLANNGPGWVAIAPDVETTEVHGGAQNDTFVVEKYAQGGAFTVFGGDGDDNCTIGNGDMSANLTNSVYFEFNGQNGTDRFTISNGVTSVPWNYNVVTGSMTAVKPSTGYSWNSRTNNIETQYVFAGSAGDTFNIDSTATGLYTEFNGAGGVDALRAGTANIAVNNIHGPISYNAGTDGGTVSVSNAGGFPATAHQDATTIGAYAGDNLFGSGGSLTFSGVTNNGATQGVIIGLASNSTLYAQPLANAMVSAFCGFIFESPSGSIKLATAGVVSPVLSGTAESGSLTSSNRQTVGWFNFTGAIQTDAIAPAFINANLKLNGEPGFAEAATPQALEVQFSENVSGLLSPASLQLTNQTAAHLIPAANIAVQWIAATNTARFTFPGYADGILPDGNYNGIIFAGLPDFFGNPLPADVNFGFFFLNADATRDRSVNLDDFTILAANFGQTGRLFTQGNFNYDANGSVNLDDFTILASQFGKTLAAPSDLPRLFNDESARPELSESSPARIAGEVSAYAPSDIVLERQQRFSAIEV